jgi:feruloyl esterase
MTHRILTIAALLAGAATFPAYAADEAACEQLSSLKLGDTRIVKAEMITPAPTWRVPDSLLTRFMGNVPITVAVPFCRVNAVIEKEINVEVWLPKDWNSRFQGVGNAGLIGSLNYPAMAAAVNAQFATASTDTGHVTERDLFQSDWIEGHPQRVIDFGHRAHHLMAARAGEIVTAFYGTRAKYNYYSGCSSGGWQGLTEAQKYPDDYDGIVAGAPAINYLGATTRGRLLGQLAAKEPEGNLDAAASQLLQQASTAKCDAQDGLKDQLVSEPLSCKFDPAELLCKAGQTQGCLNAAQVRRAKVTYGPLNSPGGMKLYPGPTWGTPAFFALPAAPAATSASPAPPPEDSITAMVRAITGRAPTWTPMTFDPDKDWAALTRDLGPIINSTDPNLKAFKARGGKLILYHGWSDPGLSPHNTLDYLENVTNTLGKPEVDAFVRTYLAPGMGHCAGGTGPSVFDAMTPLIAWVERGEAPREIVATQPGPKGALVRARPLCPHPQVARYKGSGRVEEAGSFECRMP